MISQAARRNTMILMDGSSFFIVGIENKEIKTVSGNTCRYSVISLSSLIIV
jgi:hypothetical protein